jgi:hypothetical protein
MSFSPAFTPAKIEFKKFEKIIFFSDGLVENEDKVYLEFRPNELLNGNEELFNKARDTLKTLTNDDDITVIKITKKVK